MLARLRPHSWGEGSQRLEVAGNLSAGKAQAPQLGEGSQWLEVAGNLGVVEVQAHQLRQVLQGGGVSVDFGI